MDSRKTFLHSLLAPAAQLAAWAKERPGISIVVASLFGVLLAGVMAHTLIDACFAAARHWVTSASCSAEAVMRGACVRGHWVPGEARAFWGTFRVSAQLCAEATRNPPWILLSGMVAAPSVLLTWYWRDRKRRDDHRLALESGIAERYTRAAELLASTDSMTRINGLFSLWDVARESRGHRVTVSRTLAAFVRVRSAPASAHEPNNDHLHDLFVRDTRRPSTLSEDANEAPVTPLPDVQTAATLAAEQEWGKAEWHSEGARVTLDLRSARLCAFDFARKDLSGAFLREADLSHAYLHYTNLGGALLNRAKLSGAFLRAANLRGANLKDADLSGANLIRADLRGANLKRAKLAGAKYCARTTHFPERFDPQLHGMEREDQPLESSPARDALA